MKTILFACVHNAGRSQMAAAFFNAMADPSLARGLSAGTEPGPRVHPEVVTVMLEVGIDLSATTPRLLTGAMAREAGYLVTLGCGPVCPVFPDLGREDWALEDPRGKPLDRVRGIRDDIRGRVAAFITRMGLGDCLRPFGIPSDKQAERNPAMTSNDLKKTIREKYGEAARKVSSDGSASCCGGGISCSDPITADLYAADQTREVPAEALQASLGCGNPTALATLAPGEVVLDLGSGGGLDVLLSARRVGPRGRAYGLDMTDEMLALARDNQRKAGVTNAEFLKGEIESIPLPDGSVDVIISNCVINLAADKDRVLREAFRVLKPGGRLAVSDVVVRGDVPPDLRRSVELWIGCLAGALEESEYRGKLLAAGFSDVTLETTRVYRIEEAREMLSAAGLDTAAVAPRVAGKFTSAFIRAVKP